MVDTADAHLRPAAQGDPFVPRRIDAIKATPDAVPIAVTYRPGKSATPIPAG